MLVHNTSIPLQHNIERKEYGISTTNMVIFTQKISTEMIETS